MPKNEQFEDALAEFERRHLITDVIRVLKSGKEATTFLCRAAGDAGSGLLVGKVYRDLKHRGFMRDQAYQDGRVILESRLARAFSNKSAKGREVQYSVWIDAEWSNHRLFHRAGCDVPRPIARGDKAILMEFVNSEGSEEPAQRLHEVRLSGEQAAGLWEQVLSNVSIMLAHHRIHADLSPYNVLWTGSRAVVIDFPQAVDPRSNDRAFEFLLRDLRNMADYVSRCGVERDSVGVATSLFERYWRADL